MSEAPGFLRNYWYVAAWAEEVTRAPLGRVLLDEPVVLFRTTDGRPVALENRCIHRRLPLAMGKLIGDHLQCHYHGLVFDGTGACVKIPGQERIPKAARVRSYPAVERHRCVFVWMGDPQAADESKIPDFEVLTRDGSGLVKVHREVPAHYLLIVDNLLDLSHLATVHASTVGTAHVAEAAEVETERSGTAVRVSRWTLDVPPARTYLEFGHYAGNIDRWQISDFWPPSYFKIDNGSAAAGSGAREGRGEQRWFFNVCHGITPETATSTHYFWALTHPLWTKDSAEVEEFHRQSVHVVGEDLAVFAAQQDMINRDPDAPTIDIRYDAGPNLARRIVDQLLAKEAGGAPAKARTARP